MNTELTDKELAAKWQREASRAKAQATLKEKYKNGRGPHTECKTPVENFDKVSKAMQGVKYD